MKFRSLFSFGLLAILILISAACTTADMTATYVNPELDDQLKYDQIYVSCMFNNETGEILVEEELAYELAREDVKTMLSHQMFPGNEKVFEQDRQMVYDKINEGGNDAVLTVTVIWEDSDLRYVPTTQPYTPITTYGPYYNTYWGYYGYNGPLIYEPGYYTSSREYFVEANLFDAESEELVWSGQTDTYSLADIEHTSANIADLIVDEFEEEELFSEAG